MCSNYIAAKKARQMRLHGLLPPTVEIIQAELFPGRIGPLYPNKPGLGWMQGTFGMVPHWAKPDLFRMTYNARSETVAEKPSFRSAWKHRQFCLIPCDAIFEPCYESGKPVRWRIERADGEPFALAGIWETRKVGEVLEWSYSMLTINADDHPLMRRFHKPGDEKRMIVPLHEDEFAGWLAAKSDDEARAFLKQFDPDEFSACADPLKRKITSV